MSRIALVLILGLAGAASAQVSEDNKDIPKAKGKPVKVVDFSDEPLEVDVPNIPAAEYKDLPAAGALGKLKFDDGTEYQMTPDDVFWMALMVHAETWNHPTGSDGRWMIWAIAQRIYWRGLKESFEKIIPIYSQPINKAWTLNGKHCKDKPGAGEEEKVVTLPNGKKKREYNACAKHRVEKIEKNLKLKWADLSPFARMYAVLFATARLDNPGPGVIGWLAPVVWSPGGEEGKKALTDFDDNVYYVSTKVRKVGGKKRDTESWTGSEVTVELNGKSSGIKAGAY